MDSNLYLAWFIVSCSDSIGCLVLSIFVLRRMRERYAYFLAVLLWGLSFESLIATASVLMLAPEMGHWQFAIARIIARSVKSLAVWIFSLYTLGVLNGNGD